MRDDEGRYSGVEPGDYIMPPIPPIPPMPPMPPPAGIGGSSLGISVITHCNDENVRVVTSDTIHDTDLGSAEKRSDTSSVSESCPDNLGWVDDTSSDHVNHLLIGGVEPFISIAALLDLVHDD